MKPTVTGILEAPMTTVETFCRKIIVTDGCWLYNGYIAQSGYGQFAIKGRSKFTHRIMWELVGRDIDLTKRLDHLCRVRNCVNPAHLEQVTARTNTVRGISVPAINANKTHCVRGHELSGDNLYVRKASQKRNCKRCHRDMMRLRMRRIKAELKARQEESES